MTAQTNELLLLEGRAEWLHSLPLQGYLDEHEIDLRGFAQVSSTALHRGYRATWEMVDQRLFLIGLLDAADRPIPPAVVFSNHRRMPILADWFDGRLEMGQGQALTYFHMGWGHHHESVLRLYLKRWQVVARRRYDQRRYLRRNFDHFVDANPDWLQMLVRQAHSSQQPLGGLTAAGLTALGRPELEAETNLLTWPGELSSEEEAEHVRELLRHCARAPGGVAENGAWQPIEPSPDAQNPSRT